MHMWANVKYIFHWFYLSDNFFSITSCFKFRHLLKRFLSPNTVFGCHFLTLEEEHLQISLLILRTNFKQINWSLFLLKAREKIWLLGGGWKLIITLNIKSKIWRRSLFKQLNFSWIFTVVRVLPHCLKNVVFFQSFEGYTRQKILFLVQRYATWTSMPRDI